MRIALLAPLFESVPPRLYGGTERVVANLCDGLSSLGHDVTLFASGDSSTKARLISPIKEALRLNGSMAHLHPQYHLTQLSQVIELRREFDVIHNHNEFFGLPLAHLRDTPVLTTLHGRLDGIETKELLSKEASSPYVSISNHQRRPLPHLNWIETVYHGLPLENFTFQPKAGQYLAFLGRISPEKRPDLAIQIARKAGVPLKIAAKVDPVDAAYFETHVKPSIDGKSVEYIGEIGEHEKSDFLGGALGLLFPIDWPEPFGLAPVEAWAVGTPVLARPYGSVPEIHRNGITGYIRKNACELADLVPSLEQFDRHGCRSYVEQNFSLAKMCEEYLDVYQRLIRSLSGKSEESRWREANPHRWHLLHSLDRLADRNRKDCLEGQ